jgi:hypothetical protein
MDDELVTPVQRYGQRDRVVAPGYWAIVPRPDGSEFVQRDLSTYRRTEVPAVNPPEDRSSRLGTIARAPAKEGTIMNTMGQAVLDSVTATHQYEVSRELSETGRSWLLTLKSPDGQTCVVSRLRSSREGNGM